MSAARLVVLVPAFQEEAHLPGVLATIREHCPDAELVVVDDGSRDRTGDVAHAAGATVLRHPFNLGYGAALQTGYRYAVERDADLLVQLDADGQHDASGIATLLRRLTDDRADVVIGSRFLRPTDYRMGLVRDIGRRLFARIAKSAGLVVTDPTSGFQALRRNALELYSQNFFPRDYPDVDVLLIAHRAGLRIVEESVVMRAATRPSTLHGGFKSLYYVYRLALSLWAGAGRSR